MDRPNRQERRRNGKSDELDAIEAGRAALSGRCKRSPRPATGRWKPCGRCWSRSARPVRARVRSLNQIRHLELHRPRRPSGSAPGSVSSDRLAARRRRVAPRAVTSIRCATAPSSRCAPWDAGCLELDAQLDDRRQRPRRARRRHRPRAPRAARRRRRHRRHAAGRCRRQPRTDPLRSRLGAPLRRRPDPRGIGQDHGRVRLNPGGNRQANHALWRIVITRMSSDPRTRAYLQRRLDEGLSKREIIRVLKRYVARET